MAGPPRHKHLADIAERYDGFIVDLWGVMHDGVTAFPAALACLDAIRRSGKRVVILSNAPRRVSAVTARNRELGIDERHFDHVVSSGEATWQHLSTRTDDWYRSLGSRCFHLGPSRDHGMREGLDYDFVDAVAAADFILNTGAYGFDDSVETYRDLLTEALAAELPMVCANPDLEVIRGGKREICAGAIAVYYQEMGGLVRYHGKPHREIFDRCLEFLGPGPRDRIANIGDSLRTDVAGANAAGIHSIFIAGGIHAEALGVEPGDMPDADKLSAVCAAVGQTPTVAMPVLRW